MSEEQQKVPSIFSEETVERLEKTVARKFHERDGNAAIARALLELGAAAAKPEVVVQQIKPTPSAPPGKPLVQAPVVKPAVPQGTVAVEKTGEPPVQQQTATDAPPAGTDTAKS